MKRTSKSHKRSTKLLALLLTVLMILGACPLAFAAAVKAPVTEWPTIDGTSELYVGQNYSTLKLKGGKADVPGIFEWGLPDSSTTLVGEKTALVVFRPEDTVNYKIASNRVPITVLKSEAATVEGTVFATVPKGKTLADATITKFTDFKVRSYDTTYNTAITWANPDKVMDTLGKFDEQATVAAANSSGKAYSTDVMNTIDMKINVTVVNEEDMTAVQELPVASDIHETQTLADSTLTGGVVTKGGNPLPGTFAWKDPSIVMNEYGTAKYDVVFTPTDTAACEPVYMQVSVKTRYMIEVKENPSATEIYFGQTLADSKLTGGTVTKMGEPISGTWAWKDSTIVPEVGYKGYDAVFTPDDPSVCEPQTKKVYLTTNSVIEVQELPKASYLEIGETLADSTLTGGSVTMKGEPLPGKFTWKDPTIAPSLGKAQYDVVFTPDDPEACVPHEMKVYVETMEMKIVELPTYADPLPGQYISEVKLTGGAVTKGGKPVAGTWKWYIGYWGSTQLVVGSNSCTLEFKPDDPTVGGELSIRVNVVVENIPLEITWPELKAEYKADYPTVSSCVTMIGGSASIPGEFKFNGENCYDKIEAGMGESFDVDVIFVPKDSTDYEKVKKTLQATFEQADPDCNAYYSVSSDSKTYEVSASLGNKDNWDNHTGKFYLYLDGKQMELDSSVRSFKYDYATLGVGEHTIYSEYVAGPDDYYKSGKSEVRTFTVVGIYSVTVTDSTGTNVVATHRAGWPVDVKAAAHEKPYYDFAGWTAEGIELTEEELAQERISFKMPEGDVNLTVNYKFNFQNFLKFAFEQVKVWFTGLIMQGIEWIKGLIPQQ